jgi:tetratricopeptide (TPR) repeat protein
MNIIEEYEALADAGQWEEALPVIQEIIEKNSSIDTSWFNYGVCLDALERHDEAAKAFIKAHELNTTDYGIHYRVFRSLFLANDLDQSYEFCVYLCETFADARQTLFDSDEYQELMQYKPFKELKDKYA